MKAIFSRPGQQIDRKRHHMMGAASWAFFDDNLGFDLTMAIKLCCHIFGNLDRQAIAAMERRFNISAPHRHNLRRLVAQASEQRQSLKEILKPVNGRKDHNLSYTIFQNVCEISASSQRYEMTFLKKIISTGKEMGLSQNEILRVVEKTGLAA